MLEVDDFFDGVLVASALLLELVFLVMVLEVPEVPEAEPDFFVALEEVVLVPDVVEVFFFEAIVLLAVVVLVVDSFLCAQAVTNASAARIVMQDRTDFFIGDRNGSLS